MGTYRATPDLDTAIRHLASDARILDVGGWHFTHPAATHVVDIMPYETRPNASSPGKIAERFTSETWYQQDISDPSFRLPVPDGFFDFSIFMHTLEDLHEGRPIMRELSRVARRGYIETPSRLTEQTMGISDPASTRVGFNHHKWIIEHDGKRFMLFDKAESFLQPVRKYAVPLNFFHRSELAKTVKVFWEGPLEIEICMNHAACSERARAFKQELAIGSLECIKDSCLRNVRAYRRLLAGEEVF